MTTPATTTHRLPGTPGLGAPCQVRRRGSSARCRNHASRSTSSTGPSRKALERPSGLPALAGWHATTYGASSGARFLTRDPLESVTREAYGYASANPANLVDPWGLQAEDPSYCPEGGPGADHPESPPTSLEVAACYSGADSSGGLLDEAMNVVESGAELAGRCVMDALTCLDNIKVAVSPLVIGGMTVTAGFGLVLACSTGIGCIVGVPLLGTATAGGAWATWEAMQELWFRDGHDEHYHPLGGGHEGGEHHAASASMLGGAWC